MTGTCTACGHTFEGTLEGVEQHELTEGHKPEQHFTTTIELTGEGNPLDAIFPETD